MSTDTIEGMIREGWGKPGSPFLAAYLTTYFPAAPAGWVADLSAKIQGWSLPESAILHRRVFNTLSVVDLLGKVSAPTLVIQSREDAVHTVEEGRRLAAGISNARLHVFDSPNHYITPGEAALPAFLATLRAFLTADEGQLQG